jgi:hypothetical protein
MRKIIATILLSLPLVAWADMMVLQNQQGGYIVLSKDECPIEHDKTVPMYMALATTPSTVVPGCWFFKDMLVHIIWIRQGHDPVKYQYPAEDFEFVPEKDKNTGGI